MAVCKDCLHYDVCYLIEEYGDDGATGVEYDCGNFLYSNEYEKVVRCAECKHWLPYPSLGVNDCSLHKGLVITKEDTYCPYAERKE